MRIFRHYSFKFRAIYTYLNADISNLSSCYVENLLEKLVSFFLLSNDNVNRLDKRFANINRKYQIF